MEWKGRGQRKEVGPRERQDLTSNVEGQDQRKETWKGQACEESTFPRDGKRAKAKARKVSQVENLAKIGKVHVETVPVIHTREIHTLFRAPCGSTCQTPFVQLSPMASRLFVASHVEVGAQPEFTSGPVHTVGRRLVGRTAQCETPFQKQRTTRSEPSYPSHSRH